MAHSESKAILTSAEIDELYSPPRLSEEDQRFFFSLDDYELPLILRFRERKIQAIHVLLLGYFKVKPVVIKCTSSDLI